MIKKLFHKKILKKKIEELEYKVVKEQERKSKVNIQGIYILVMLLAIYIIFSHLGWLNIFNIFI